MFELVEKKSLSDAVFEQLRQRIVDGELEIGEALPSERGLCMTLGVNRGALREALKRLEECRLVRKHQGGATRVLDFRRTGTMSLLEALLAASDGRVSIQVVRSVVEMRTALGPDIARLAALRRTPDVATALGDIVARMRSSAGQLRELQIAALEFWDTLVDGSDNLAYRFAFNTLRDGYTQSMELLGEAVWEEVTHIDGYARLAECIRDQDTEQAQVLARELMNLSDGRIHALLNQYEALGKGDST